MIFQESSTEAGGVGRESIYLKGGTEALPPSCPSKKCNLEYFCLKRVMFLQKSKKGCTEVTF